MGLFSRLNKIANYVLDVSRELITPRSWGVEPAFAGTSVINLPTTTDLEREVYYKPINLDSKIKLGLGNLTTRVRELYRLVVEEETLIGLDKAIKSIREITDNARKDARKLRQDLMTLESLIIARKGYETGKLYNMLGEKIEEPDKEGYKNFRHYIQLRLNKADRLDSETQSPFIAEEGVFHYSSLREHGIFPSLTRKNIIRKG